MSVDYRIIAPSEATAVFDDPSNHHPTTILCDLSELLAWIAARGAAVHPRNTCYSVVTNAAGDGAEMCVDSEGDDAITQITFYVYGDGFDYPLIGDCAARFGGIVFDRQTSEVLTPDAYLRRCRGSGR
jgi:hypothetical protein